MVGASGPIYAVVHGPAFCTGPAASCSKSSQKSSPLALHPAPCALPALPVLPALPAAAALPPLPPAAAPAFALFGFPPFETPTPFALAPPVEVVPPFAASVPPFPPRGGVSALWPVPHAATASQQAPTIQAAERLAQRAHR